MRHVDRSERAFLLGNEVAERLEGEILARLAPSRFGDNGRSRVRSVYLDTESGALSERIVADPRNSTKLRLRTYRPGRPGALPGDREVWVEIKRRAGDRVTKCRFRTVWAAIPAVLRGGTLPYGVCDQDSYIAQAALRRIQAGRRLHATVCVEYVRQSYESTDGALRITFDRELTACRPPVGFPRQGGRPWQAFGERACLFPGTVLEVKLRVDLVRQPAWLSELIAPFEPQPFSKAGAALLGHDANRVGIAVG